MAREGSEEYERMRYVSLMRPIFRKRAVFSDESKFYRSPAEPKPGDDVTIRLRTMKKLRLRTTNPSSPRTKIRMRPN